MRSYKLFILSKYLEEALKNKDLNFYVEAENTKDYILYFDKHLLKRKSRNYEWSGLNSDLISTNKILKSFHKAYNKIIALYNSNKLEYSKTSNQAFAIIDKTYDDDLVIIGFIYDMDTKTLKYDICLKTVIFKNDFKCKNNSLTKIIPILIKETFNEIQHLIIVENE